MVYIYIYIFCLKEEFLIYSNNLAHIFMRCFFDETPRRRCRPPWGLFECELGIVSNHSMAQRSKDATQGGYKQTAKRPERQVPPAPCCKNKAIARRFWVFTGMRRLSKACHTALLSIITSDQGYTTGSNVRYLARNKYIYAFSLSYIEFKTYNRK